MTKATPSLENCRFSDFEMLLSDERPTKQRIQEKKLMSPATRMTATITGST